MYICFQNALIGNYLAYLFDNRESVTMIEYILAMSTCRAQDAEEISLELVKSRTCVCVNIIKAVHSIYHWMGKIEQEEECLLLIKTEASKEEDLMEALLRVHPYVTPEFITIPIRSGSLGYLEWISSNLGE